MAVRASLAFSIAGSGSPHVTSAFVLALLGGTTWASDGFWAPDGAYAVIAQAVVFL
ncbi:MAG TPA: hypothetical protein VFU10_03395 [Gaiellaceae bacterium]|nr:hypothetical protein [Gaiellaceae bacterium]